MYLSVIPAPLEIFYRPRSECRSQCLPLIEAVGIMFCALSSVYDRLPLRGSGAIVL